MKRSILLLSGAALALSALAAPLSPEEALQRVRANGPSKVAARATVSGNTLAYTSVSENGLNSAYLFNLKDGGYMVLAADDVAYPMLGYSDTGSVNADYLAPEMKWWLEEYGRQIDWAINNGKTKASDIQKISGLTPIAPLVKTKWNQDAPFNDLCPIPKTVNGQPYTGGKHAYTGCVATAMAQVMKYFNYPEAGTGTIQYIPTRNGYTYDKQTWNLAKHPFAWDKMLNVYSKDAYTEEEGEAVANLMKSCGFSVEMSYGLDASGASGLVIAEALRTYFKYNDNTRSQYREICSSEMWAQMIYDNLKNVGPVIINGQSPDGGHSFVCDGYDGNGFFHFNWGWGGTSDGYFLLEALNPDAQGIGGYTGGFNFMQNAILGAQPPVEGESGYDDPVRVYQYGTLTASVSGKLLTFGVKDYHTLGWGNTSDRRLNAKIGVIIESVDDSKVHEIVEGYLATNSRPITDLSLSAHGYYPDSGYHPEIEIPALGNGKYKVTLASYDNECNNKEWVPVAAPWGFPNYVYLTVENGSYVVTEVPVAKLIINSADVVTDLYYGRFFKIKANITNNSDLELTQYFSPALYEGTTRKYYGESVGISVQPGTTVDYEWVSKLSVEPGVTAPTKETEYTLGLYNPDPNANKNVYGYFGKVNLMPTPSSSPRLNIVELGVKGEQTTVDFDNRELTTTLVSNPDDVEVTFTYHDAVGYFDGVMKLSLTYRLEGSYTSYPVIDEIATSQPFLKSGESDTITATFSIPDPIQGALYQVNAAYTLNSKWTSLGSVGFMTGLSGIDDIGIGDEDDETVEYYNLQGQRILNPSHGEMVIVKSRGKTRKIIF